MIRKPLFIWLIIGTLFIFTSCGPLLNSEQCPVSRTEPVSYWDMEKLDQAFDLACELGTSSLIVSSDNKILRAMGSLNTPRRVHSVRKALLSALVGQHLGSGPDKIDLNSTLAELNIDDTPGPLTDLQKTTTVLHLVKSISGINHPAAAEAGLMGREKTRRLGRTPNVPGTKWAYNNWDYNALTSIFSRQTGLPIDQAFERSIAEPLHMEDFTKSHVYYEYEKHLSMHPKAGFALSASDLLKFGQLYLNRGKWEGEQIIPASWIDRITRDYVETGRTGLRSAHSYLWWVPIDDASRRMGVPKGTFMAAGFGSQRVVVIPAWDTVIVHQVDTAPFFACCRQLIREKGISFAQAAMDIMMTCRLQGKASKDFCQSCGWAFNFLESDSFDSILETILAARTQN